MSQELTIREREAAKVPLEPAVKVQIEDLTLSYSQDLIDEAKLIAYDQHQSMVTIEHLKKARHRMMRDRQATALAQVAIGIGWVICGGGASTILADLQLPHPPIPGLVAAFIATFVGFLIALWGLLKQR